MRLIASIEEADIRRIRCRAKEHAGPDYPLRLHGVLYTAALVELGAQAAAAHASVFGMRTAHSGLVIALGDLDLRCVRVDEPDPLRIEAEHTDQIAGAVSYRFAVSQREDRLVTGVILISLVPV